MSQSQFHNELLGDQIDPEEVQLHMLIATLMSKLSRSERQMFGDIMHRSSKMSTKENTDLLRTQLPLCEGDIRRMYVRGKHAILPNLPQPKVQWLGNHGYVSLRDCIADLLGHGTEVALLDNKRKRDDISCIEDSPCCRSIWKNATALYPGEDILCMFAVEWSDDFEPSTSVKSNRGSVWLKSVTISPPHGQQHQLSHTYPVAIGSKDDNHEPIEVAFAKELHALSCGEDNIFFHGGLQKNVRVHIELLASLQDQPERRGTNKILLGSSNFTARWGYSTNFSAVQKHLVPCPQCRRSLLQQHIIPQNCPTDSCVCWDLDRESPLLTYTPHSDFPQDQIPDTNVLKPFQLSYQKMNDAVLLAHHCFVEERWTGSNVKAYLNYFGLNTDAVAQVLENARNCQTLAAAEKNRDEEPDAYAELQNEKLQHPPLFAPWSPPACWSRGTEMSCHIDVPMHLLFLGITRTCTQQIQEWMKLRGKYQTFLAYATGKLEKVQQLHLPWCRSLPYSQGKLGGWVSENYVALAHLMTWFYSMIGFIAADPTFVAPNRPQHQWTMVHNRGWLSCRGLDVSGNAEDLRTRVQVCMSYGENTPKPLGPRGGSVTKPVNVICAMRTLISHLMQKVSSEEKVQHIEYLIKVFLTCFEEFDMNTRAEGSKPTWVTSYNFVCLLNLPQVITKYGPIRNYWEGGGMGEKIIQSIKPHWRGHRKNWQINLLSKMLTNMAITRVAATGNEQHIDSDSDDDNDNDADEDKQMTVREYHLYKDEKDIKEDFMKMSPLSVVLLSDDSMGSMLKTGEMVLIRRTGFYCTLLGMAYHHWRLGETTTPCNPKVKLSAVMLPLLQRGGANQNQSVYTVTTSDWLDIQQDGTYKLPTFNYSE